MPLTGAMRGVLATDVGTSTPPTVTDQRPAVNMTYNGSFPDYQRTPPVVPETPRPSFAMLRGSGPFLQTAVRPWRWNLRGTYFVGGPTSSNDPSGPPIGNSFMVPPGRMSEAGAAIVAVPSLRGRVFVPAQAAQ